MSIYWVIVTAVIALGMIMPQKGKNRIHYVIAMAILHAFVCGFRYKYLTGDLMKYAYDYGTMPYFGWFSENVFHEGRNAGFFWSMKLMATLTNSNFQIFLIALAVITQISVAVLIYRYSPMPWLSYLVYNCMGYYVAGFSLIKQYFAMAIILWAMMAVFEKKPTRFYALTLLAGFIHMPALCFLPAYFIANRRINAVMLSAYAFAAAIVFVFRAQIVYFTARFYYEEETFVLASNSVGGRFLVILVILASGLLLKGFKEKNYERLFNMIIIAAIFQMFSVFDNVFSRLTDYYLQFLVLFIPMIFFNSTQKVETNKNAASPIMALNEGTMRFLVVFLVLILVWWYNRTCIGVTIRYAVDDYTNFRFMWDVM